MKNNKVYTIPVKGLAQGEHHYNFVVEDMFFEEFPDEEIHHAHMHLVLDVEKEARLMDLQFRFKGTVRLSCDRCLEEYDQPLEGNFRLIVKFGEKKEEISDEIMTIPFNESHFDIAPFVYEFIRLMIPMKHVHPDDENGNSTCNVKMLEKLENLMEKTVDPRWAALENLKIK